MLTALSSPAVCVIDDEKADYEPILAVLNSCFISAVHLSGTLESLPPSPFPRLQLVFLDLHLTGSIGKDAASYTANFFRKAVAPTTAPLVVVIWSKYSSDPAGDEETEAALFKRTLLEAAPDYEGRLIFVEMSKPKPDVRPVDWRDQLKSEIEQTLQGLPAIEVLWKWNELVKEGCAQVSRDMTLTAGAAIAGTTRSLPDGLTATMQKLAVAQSEGNFVPATAPKYLVSILSQLLLDQLEHPEGIASIAAHGAWLGGNPAGNVAADFPARMNGLLITSEHSAAAPFAPGTVFKITDHAGFNSVFGKSVDDLLSMWVKPASKEHWPEWQKSAQPVLIELSPVCDLAQGHRVSALLVAGIVVPSAMASKARKVGEAFGQIAVNFYVRWQGNAAFPAQEVALGYCNRYKATVPAGQMVNWLEPWFRLRELPVASIRNANAAHAARVGYASVV